MILHNLQFLERLIYSKLEKGNDKCKNIIFISDFTKISQHFDCLGGKLQKLADWFMCVCLSQPCDQTLTFMRLYF